MLRKLGRINRTREPDDGVPPGQFTTAKFPVLTFGRTPDVDVNEWRMRAFGLVESERAFDWDEFVDLGRVTIDAEFHCVTQWSRLENTWKGVPIGAVLDAARPLPEAPALLHPVTAEVTDRAADLERAYAVVRHALDAGVRLPPGQDRALLASEDRVLEARQQHRGVDASNQFGVDEHARNAEVQH